MFSRRVTVFGGTGFLGRRIVRHLHNTNLAVRIASRHPPQPSLKDSEPSLTWVLGLRPEVFERAGVAQIFGPSLPPRRDLQYPCRLLPWPAEVRVGAVFAASACREGVLAVVSELTFFVVLNCSSARRRLASPSRGWERIGTASFSRWSISPGSTRFPEYHWKRGDIRPNIVKVVGPVWRHGSA
jgi:hypothetical protein